MPKHAPRKQKARTTPNRGVRKEKIPRLLNWYSSADEGLLTKAETKVWLEYIAQYSISSATTSTCARYIKTNDAYDVDPAFLSTSTPGFLSYSKLYSYFRVIGYEDHLVATNNNTLPVIFSVLNTNVTLGLSSGNNTTIDLLPSTGNQYCQTKVLAGNTSGANQKTFVSRHSICEVVGNTAPETEDNFRGASTASPVDLTYMLFGATSFAGATIPTNVSIFMRHWMLIRFYDRIPESS
jgi:hypothetical protein